MSDGANKRKYTASLVSFDKPGRNFDEDHIFASTEDEAKSAGVFWARAAMRSRSIWKAKLILKGGEIAPILNEEIDLTKF
jgi:hypothetical protein